MSPWPRSRKTWDAHLSYAEREALSLPRQSQQEVAIALVAALCGEPWWTNDTGIYHRHTRLITTDGHAALHLHVSKSRRHTRSRKYVCDFRATYPDSHIRVVLMRHSWQQFVEGVGLCREILREYSRAQLQEKKDEQAEISR